MEDDNLTPQEKRVVYVVLIVAVVMVATIIWSGANYA
jgi:hypothetical protein